MPLIDILLTSAEATREWDKIRSHPWVLHAVERGYISLFADRLHDPRVFATLACEFALFHQSEASQFLTAASRDPGASFMYWTRRLIMEFDGPMLHTSEGPLGRQDPDDFLDHWRKSFYGGVMGWDGDWELAFQADEFAKTSTNLI